MRLPDPDNLRIVHYPDPVLKKVCAPVEEFGPELKALADKMLALMHEAEGAGLAGPQVGIPIRLFVCNPTGEPGNDLVCVNPRFIELTGGEEKEEGCLSIPGVSVTTRRATQAVMEAWDTDGKPFRRTGCDLEARIWQHEADHLEGRLLTDNMATTDEIANRRAVRQLEADYAATSRA
ncbi:MAG: peptide deformylase [Phycisphaerales bacterium]|nr:MAG: peptide deformylase [Phycisphaerales bacterium]